MSELTDLIPADGIRTQARAKDWREAIRLAGDLLVSTGIAEDEYTDAMIRTVDEHGPYIVIAPGFALAHARPDASVHRTGLSFLSLAEPVPFGSTANDPVRLVMALAATDAGTHQKALAALASVLARPKNRAALDAAQSADEVRAALEIPEKRSPVSGTPAASAAPVAESATPAADAGNTADEETVPSKNLILTVCGNGLGTSLFLKNTTEQVLDRWGWSPYLTVEATDTISAKGKAEDADFLLTSGAIAQTLGDVGVPVEVIENFTSTAEIDAVLRRMYAV